MVKINSGIDGAGRMSMGDDAVFAPVIAAARIPTQYPTIAVADQRLIAAMAELGKPAG
jgi:hypothetical protein